MQDTTETSPPKARLRRQLGAFGAIMLSLSAISPVLSIYALGPETLSFVGTGAILVFAAAVVATAIWAGLYGELGSAYPFAGADYVGVGKILGPWAGFVSLMTWVATSGPAIAVSARSIGEYGYTLIATATSPWSQSIPPEIGAGLTNGLTAVALIVGVGIAALSLRKSLWVTGLFLILEFVGCAGLVALAAPNIHWARLPMALLHPQVCCSNLGRLVPAARDQFGVAAVLAFYAIAGGNQALAFGEEMKSPHRDMGKVVLWAAMIGAFATATPLILMLLSTPKLEGFLDTGQSTPAAVFVKAYQGSVGVYYLCAVVILAMLNAMVVQIMFNARILYSFGRDRSSVPLLDKPLSRIDPQKEIPAAAAVLAGLFAAVCCFWSKHQLIIFGTGIVASSLALVSAAVLIGRRRGLTGSKGFARTPLFPLVPLVGLLLAGAVVAVEFLDTKHGGQSGMEVYAGIIVFALVWYAVLKVFRPGWRPNGGLEALEKGASDD